MPKAEHRREVDRLLCEVVDELLALPRLGLRQSQTHDYPSSFTIEIPAPLMQRVLEAQELCRDREEVRLG